METEKQIIKESQINKTDIDGERERETESASAFIQK